MTQTLGKNPRTWLPILLLVISMSAAGWAEEKSSGNYEALAHEVITKLDEFEYSGSDKYTKWRPELQRLQFRIKQYLILAESELKHAKELEEKGRAHLYRATTWLEELDAGAEKSYGLRIQSTETIEFLIRNCLIEDQRLRLDYIAARTVLEKNSKPNDREFEATRLRLEAEEVSLHGLNEKLKASLKELAELKDDHPLAIKKQISELENEIAVRATKLRAMKAELEQAKASRATTSEDQVMEIKLRQEMLSAQLERLAKQQKGAEKAKLFQAEMRAAMKQTDEANDRVIKAEMKMHELTALNELINNIVDPKKKKE